MSLLYTFSGVLIVFHFYEIILVNDAFEGDMDGLSAENKFLVLWFTLVTIC